MALPLSVFRGASVILALMLSGCGANKPGGLAAPPDGDTKEVAPVREPDDGGVDVTGVPTPDGATVSVPPACQVQTSAAAPYSVKFRFRNRASVPVFRYRGCTSEVEIASCASAYSDQLASRVSCPCDCATGFCPTCGPCSDEGTPLAPDAIFEEEWNGLVAVQGTGAVGRICNDWKAVPAGRYRVRLPVYASAADAKAHAPTLAVATADFQLPTQAVDGVIQIDIAP